MALAATSCEFESKDESGRTGYNLAKYTENILQKFLVIPSEDLRFMLTLDEYLSLTPEEQNLPDWEIFRAEITHYTSTLLRIKYKGISIETGGKSLRTPGNYWIMTLVDSDGYSADGGYYYHANDQYDSTPGHGPVKRITCVAENEYEITDEKGGREMMCIFLETVPCEGGGYDLSGSVTGKIGRNDRGLSADFKATEFYSKRLTQSSDGTGNSSVKVWYETINLDFELNTYHNGSQLDWCRITEIPGKGYEISSNLEIKSPLPYRE